MVVEVHLVGAVCGSGDQPESNALSDPFRTSYLEFLEFLVQPCKRVLHLLPHLGNMKQHTTIALELVIEDNPEHSVDELVLGEGAAVLLIKHQVEIS